MVPEIMNCGSKKLKVVVQGRPVPQGRPKFAGNHGYDPPASRKYKKAAKEAIEEAIYEQGWTIVNEDTPVKIEMIIYKPVLKSYPKWYTLAGILGLIAPLKKNGDIENIAKGIMDAGTGLIYKDDCQVYSLHCEHRFAEEPRVEMTVEAMFVDLGDVKDKVRIYERGQSK